MCPDESARLPIQHPDYRYPESSNPYWLKLNELQHRVFCDNETERHRGKWRSLLLDGREDASRELHVEIGCNGGHVVLEWAARNPKHAYIGIDWKFKQIYRGAEKALKRGIENLLFLRANAQRLQYMFAENEIDHLYLLFPDPWPRKGQQKNRFVNPKMLETVAGLVRPGGVFHIRTDHAGYFEWIDKAVAETGQCWKVIGRSTDLYRNHPDPKSLMIPDVTLFERIFIRDGIPICSLELERTR